MSSPVFKPKFNVEEELKKVYIESNFRPQRVSSSKEIEIEDHSKHRKLNSRDFNLNNASLVDSQNDLEIIPSHIKKKKALNLKTASLVDSQNDFEVVPSHIKGKKGDDLATIKDLLEGSDDKQKQKIESSLREKDNKTNEGEFQTKTGESVKNSTKIQENSTEDKANKNELNAENSSENEPEDNIMELNQKKDNPSKNIENSAVLGESEFQLNINSTKIQENITEDKANKNEINAENSSENEPEDKIMELNQKKDNLSKNIENSAGLGESEFQLNLPTFLRSKINDCPDLSGKKKEKRGLQKNFIVISSYFL